MKWRKTVQSGFTLLSFCLHQSRLDHKEIQRVVLEGQDADVGARTFVRRVYADLRAGSLPTAHLASPKHKKRDFYLISKRDSRRLKISGCGGKTAK
ncbi:hypothetical protein PoB_006997100 [Plakobranchus ocellatus]|uniref:Uncharacterized protein n=1 Tax=Plakobranchus ocellatus TaxID=259542 RepID=A0AAV4DH47_9GAST|nr:hypothetical protein PoB_006997100 [Plakobranchus ocellatus]